MALVAPMEFGLCVKSIDQCLAFYEGLLGLEVVQRRRIDANRSAAIAYSSVGHRVVKLQAPYGERFKLLEGETATPTAPSRNILSAPGRCFLTLIVDDLDGLAARLRNAGCAFRTTPDIVVWQSDLRVSIVDDPEGNPVELCEFIDLSRYRPDIQPPATKHR